MTKLRLFYAALCGIVLSLAPISFVETPACQAVTYKEVKSTVADISGGAKRFWDDSAPDREKLTKKAAKKWNNLQKKIAKKRKKAKKGGKKALKKFKKWRKKQEKEFWNWYNNQMNQ